MPKKTTQSSIDYLAELIASGQSISAAARAVGIADRTARNLVTKPEFKRVVAELRHDVMAQISGKMSDVAMKAVAGLLKLVEDESLDAELRLKVCRGVVADWVAIGGQVDLARRMAEAEEKLERALGLAGSDTAD